MKETDPLWIAIGLSAQAAFSARFLVQWLLSERARRSLLPVHFWRFSIAGAVLLLAYAAHQRDPVIALGQVVGLGIYLRNVELVRRAAHGRATSFFWPWMALGALAITVGLISHEEPVSAAATRSAPLWMLIGFIGQILFTGRFVVQLWYSERAQESVNPVAFWYLSMSGSLLLLGYAISTSDLVIILGQSFGMLVYVRNLVLIRRQVEPDHHGEGLAAEAAELREAEGDETGVRSSPASRTELHAGAPSARYPGAMIALHWATLLLIIGAYASIELREMFPRGSELREGLKSWHFQLGLTVLLLTLARIFLHFRTRVPPVAPPLQSIQRIAATGMHLALYAFLLAMPLLGWALLDLEGKSVVWFGLTLPDLLATGRGLAEPLEEIHETLGKIGYGLIGLHAASALFHHYIQRDNTLTRMLPGR